MSKTIGLYFGSFNPIHMGHLIVAQAICQVPDIQEVWFVVSPQNPFKKQKTLLHEFDRFDMVERAIADNPKFKVTDIEFGLPKPSYTIDTLQVLSGKYPNFSFRVIMGSDNLENFENWRQQEKILNEYGLIVYPRPNYPLQNHLLENPKVLIIKDVPLMDISATYIRTCIQNGFSIRYLVPDSVADLIGLKKYYEV